MIGEQVERNPALAAEVAAAGHEIALHGHRHRLVLRVAPGAFADDLDRGAAVIQDATGVVPALHRPPYGIYSTAGLVLARRRFRPLLWSRWGRDWRRHITPERIAQLVTRELSPGDVLLLHDADTYSQAGSHRRTAAALPLVLDAVERLGTAVAGPIGERALAV
jgi:peptidoglycan/xylan/chitin deacetylase (PgdA/CDA1 family)